MERSLDKKKVISELLRSPHGDLRQYLDTGLRVAKEDADFLGHMIAWNHGNGEVKDSKVALPVIALLGDAGPSNVFHENGLAHLAALRPREYNRSLEFAKDVKAPQRLLRRLTERYLRDLEADRRAWIRTALQHRGVLKSLWGRWALGAPGGKLRKTDPDTYENAVLFGTPPAGSPFAVLGTLKDLGPEEIAGAIERYKIPFLTASGALGSKGKDPDVVLALMKRMTAAELVTNMTWLERRGVKTVPALRSALEEAIGKAAASKKAPKGTLKTTRAAEALGDDEKLAGKLRVLQEKQLDKLGGIDGNWLVLADKSGSMRDAMETARHVAAILARMVRGKIHLIFFDESPRYYDATGKSYEEIKALTGTMTDNGGTSIGVGLDYCMTRKIAVEGIAIVSDGCENRMPQFADVYRGYVRTFPDADPPTVYWYAVGTAYPPEAVRRYGHHAVAHQANQELANFLATCAAAKIDLQKFDLTGGTDYYALPNVISTMRVSRYSLLDEILATPLISIDSVLSRTVGFPVLPRQQQVTA
jgi:hypothetical protein